MKAFSLFTPLVGALLFAVAVALNASVAQGIASYQNILSQLIARQNVTIFSELFNIDIATSLVAYLKHYPYSWVIEDKLNFSQPTIKGPIVRALKDFVAAFAGSEDKPVWYSLGIFTAYVSISKPAQWTPSDIQVDEQSDGIWITIPADKAPEIHVVLKSGGQTLSDVTVPMLTFDLKVFLPIKVNEFEAALRKLKTYMKQHIAIQQIAGATLGSYHEVDWPKEPTLQIEGACPVEFGPTTFTFDPGIKYVSGVTLPADGFRCISVKVYQYTLQCKDEDMEMRNMGEKEKFTLKHCKRFELKTESKKLFCYWAGGKATVYLNDGEHSVELRDYELPGYKGQINKGEFNPDKVVSCKRKADCQGDYCYECTIDFTQLPSWKLNTIYPLIEIHIKNEKGDEVLTICRLAAK